MESSMVLYWYPSHQYGTQDEDKQNKNTTDHYNEAMSVRLSHFCKIFYPGLHISW
jgi:hypothetical protein